MAYVLDTNIFNWLLDGRIRFEQLPIDADYVATHIQIDEINRTLDAERRAALFLQFAAVRPKMVPTESFVWDVSRWDNAKWGEGVLFEKLKADLDTENGSRPSNAADALIAEVAIANEYTLVTADQDLAEVARRHAGKVRVYEP